jgi:hypothetical protein
MKKNNIASLLKIQPPDIFCAVDASTNNMAFAYFVNQKLTKYGKINFNGENVYEKIGDIAQKTKSFFVGFPTENLIVEKPIFANSPLVAANLALTQGSLMGAAKLGGVKNIYGVTPIAWQSFIGTRLLNPEERDRIKTEYPAMSSSWYKTKEREQRKQKTIKTINKKFNIDISDNDIADACGIGIFVLNNWGKVV